MPAAPVTRLKPFQDEGVRGIYGFRGRALLADEQGLGKTIQALYWVKKIPKRRPAVIVAPSTVKYTWQAEAALHFGMRIDVIDGQRPKRKMTLPGPIVVINYEILKSWLPALLRAGPQLVIFDEIHYIKNHDTQRTKASIKLSEQAASVIGLSGTPLTNRPIELWPIMQAIRPDLFPDRLVFAWRYTKPFRWRGRWHFEGSQNLEELHSILTANVMIRRLKKDVMPQLPKKIRKVVPFSLGRASEYQKAHKNFLGWLKEISPARAKRAKKVEAMAKVGYLLRLVAELKSNWTLRWIEDFLESNPDKKLVAFTMHTKVIERLEAKFGDISVTIDGSVTGRKRQEVIRRFQNHRKTRLLNGNWKAAGVGATLTAAHNVAALDLPWTPGDMMQGEDRIHRIGQDELCIIHYLIAMKTVEEKQVKILRSKRRVLDAVLDGKAPANGKPVDMFGELIEELIHG